MPTKIMHGRRKGEKKTDVFDIKHNDSNMPTTDLSNVTILSKGDWERIQYQLHRKQIEQRQLDKLQADRETMKEKSRSLVQYWSNTIAGQRQMKLEARKLREQKEEEEKKAMDIEEAKFQAEKRKNALDRAKTQMYYQTDRVRGLHTALKLTEVLKEREGQVELKCLRAQALEGQENEWVHLDKKQYEEYVTREQEKAAFMSKTNVENAKFIKDQRGAQIDLEEKEKIDDFREGQELKRLAEAYRVEREKLNDIRKAERWELRSDNEKQIHDQECLRDILQQQRNEEDQECKLFAAAKRKMIRMRGAKEQEIQNEKLKRLDGISQKLAVQMKSKIDDEDERIINAAEEKDEIKRLEEERKEKIRCKNIADMDENRKQQYAEHDEDRRKYVEEQLEERKHNKEMDEIFIVNEKVKEEKRFDNNSKVAQFRVDQHRDKLKKETDNIDIQLALDQKNYELFDTEEQQFQEYATKVIDHCKKGGRNVVPLVKAAREGACGGQGPVFPGKGGIRPSYMASDQSAVQLPRYNRDETEGVKQLVEGKSGSKKRLGFVW